MQIEEITARYLQADLPAPMRSRGAPGFQVHHHTGSERQRLALIELLGADGARGFTLLPGTRDAIEPLIDDLARPALRAAGSASLFALRDALIKTGGERGLAPLRLASFVSALEAALWDLQGKSLGRPIFALLGGAGDRAPIYAGGGSLCFAPPEELVKEARRYVAQGFRAMKIKIGHGPQEDAALVRAIRQAVAPDIELMVDANCSYDLDSALRLLPDLAALGVIWFEEPLPRGEREGYRRLRGASPVKIAGGEGCFTLTRVRELLSEEMVDILQPDMGLLGLSSWLAIAEMARETGVQVTPHVCNSALGLALALHLQLAIANGVRQEFETFDNPFVREIFNEPWQIEDGCCLLPDGPGLGFTPSEDTVAKHLVSPSAQ
jgi:L-alanine-DL-glutamate epimerase-like enolase superfamily enzyme